MNKLTQDNIINIVTKLVIEQGGTTNKFSERGGKDLENTKRKPYRGPSSSTSAPGHHLFSSCSAGGAPCTSTANSPQLAFYLEYAPGWNGNGGQGSSAALYDSVANSQSLFNIAGGNLNIGDTVHINIDGVPQGCHQYNGTSSSPHWPIFFAGTIDSQGNPHPPTAQFSQVFSDCFGCVCGAIDPYNPLDHAVLDDSVDMAEGSMRTRIKNLLKAF